MASSDDPLVSSEWLAAHLGEEGGGAERGDPILERLLALRICLEDVPAQNL